MQTCVKQCLKEANGKYGYLEKIIIKRNISSSQLQTSLRPFKFLCHPDLFMRFPEQRAINESSLQTLSAYLEQLQRGLSQVAQSKSLPFYLRNNKDTSNPFRLVHVPLHKERNTKTFVMNILKICDLETSYIENVPSPTKHQPASSSFQQKSSNIKYSVYDEEGRFSEDFDLFQFKVRKAKEDETLKKFLKKNFDLATIRTMALDVLREEVQKLKIELEKKLELNEIIYNCGWNMEHFRGCLKTLEKMHQFHAEDMKHLKGKNLIFSQFTGVSVDGDVHLFTGDVQNSWRDLIKNIPRQEIYLSKIPMYENTLSQVLLNIKIARRKFMPKTIAKSYSSHLSKVITNLLDYLTKNKFPSTWPENGLSTYELVVENESGPLMLSPTGQLICPSTCPGFLLVDFITRHLEEATIRRVAYDKNKYIERDLHKKCIDKLELNSLLKDDNITPELMITCMDKLLSADIKFNNLNVHVTNYYSILSDGTICIPWNFICTDSL